MIWSSMWHVFHLAFTLLAPCRKRVSVLVQWPSDQAALWPGRALTPRLGPKTPHSSHQNPVSLESSPCEDIHSFPSQKGTKEKDLKRVGTLVILRSFLHNSQGLMRSSEYIPCINWKQIYGECLIYKSCLATSTLLKAPKVKSKI